MIARVGINVGSGELIFSPSPENKLVSDIDNSLVYKTFKEEVRERISKSNIEEAFKYAIRATIDNSIELFKSIVILHASYLNLREDLITGRINYEDYSGEMNKICYAFLNVLSE
ncbi:MAG: hypothetical protein MRZ79_00045 [Bacteroidia bacterium]|nr:hypothetical protein [Bacteroidia bacterium]